MDLDFISFFSILSFAMTNEIKNSSIVAYDYVRSIDLLDHLVVLTGQGGQGGQGSTFARRPSVENRECFCLIKARTTGKCIK